MSNDKHNEAAPVLGCDRLVGVKDYHLLEELWIIRADDEALDHDCQSWWRMDSHPSGRWMIGKPYTRNLFVPMRRPGPRPADKISELLDPNDADQRREPNKGQSNER